MVSTYVGCTFHTVSCIRRLQETIAFCHNDSLRRSVPHIYTFENDTL